MIDLLTVDDVLILWFGNAPLIDAQSEWFTKSNAFDTEVYARFLPLWKALSTGGADIWMDMSFEAIARIVVLDQFSRNMFRGIVYAFASDAATLHTAQIVTVAGRDARLPTRHHRVFRHLPFEHGEALSTQDEPIRLYTRLHNQEGDASPFFWAEKHREIAARFGHFPHHNEALGRVSTSEEVEFLKQPGSSFWPWWGLRTLAAFRPSVDRPARRTR